MPMNGGLERKKIWDQEVRFDLIEYYPQENRLVHLDNADRS